MAYREMKQPETQEECDRHNARRARAFAKAKALRAEEQAKCETMKASRAALAETNDRKEEHRAACRETESAWRLAVKAANAAESRAEGIPYATLDDNETETSLIP